MKHTARAALAVLLLVGVYVLGLAVVLGVVAIVVALARAGLHGPLLIKGGIVAAGVLVAVAKGLFSRRRVEPDPPGVLLSPEQEPRLWAEVRELARTAGTRPPDEIRLVPEVNAAVEETSRWLGLVGGTRRLYLGVPLVTGLTELQLRSVLAHELGHYSGRHTALSRVTYRGSEALGRTLARLEDHVVVGGVFRLYARLYFAVSNSVNRRQELEADASSARVAGGAAAAAALREVGVIDTAWRHFLEAYGSLGTRTQARPVGFFVGFARFWAEPSRQEELAALRLAPEPERPASVYDSHPPTTERVALLEALEPDPAPDESGPAHELLTDPADALDRLERWMFDGSPLEGLGWDELVDRAAREHTHDHAIALTRALEAQAVEAGAPETVTLGSVLLAVRDQRADDLVRPLLEPGTEGRPLRAATVQAVTGLVAEALLRAEAARFRVDWSGPWVLVDAAGEPLGVGDRVRSAFAGGEAVDDLAEWLDGLGVDLHHRPEVPPPLDLAAEAASDAVPVELHAAVAGLTHPLHTNLVLFNKGILVTRLSRWDLRAYVLHVYGDPTKAVLRRLLETDPADLIRRRGRFVAWGDVTEVRRGRTLTRQPCYVVRTSSGSRWRVARSLVSEVAGDPELVLRAYLGDRLVGS